MAAADAIKRADHMAERDAELALRAIETGWTLWIGLLAMRRWSAILANRPVTGALATNAP